jgi:hypothetical protein
LQRDRLQRCNNRIVFEIYEQQGQWNEEYRTKSFWRMYAIYSSKYSHSCGIYMECQLNHFGTLCFPNHFQDNEHVRDNRLYLPSDNQRIAMGRMPAHNLNLKTLETVDKYSVVFTFLYTKLLRQRLVQKGHRYDLRALMRELYLNVS